MPDLPAIEAPPLAPLNDEQLRFLALHKRHVIAKSNWIFQGAQLRAHADDNKTTATISLVRFGALVDGGLIEVIGCAGVRLTDKGKAAV